MDGLYSGQDSHFSLAWQPRPESCSAQRGIDEPQGGCKNIFGGGVLPSRGSDRARHEPPGHGLSELELTERCHGEHGFRDEVRLSGTIRVRSLSSRTFRAEGVLAPTFRA